MITIGQAIMSLRPNAEWSLDGDTLIWHDETQTKPTKEELESEVVRLQAEYDAKQYQRDRASAYPSLQEQLDMQYWDAVNGTTVWQDTIQAIKAKYPKGV